jgi:hypothetical protein
MREAELADEQGQEQASVVDPKQDHARDEEAKRREGHDAGEPPKPLEPLAGSDSERKS